MRKDSHEGAAKSDGMTNDASLVTNVEQALKADSVTSALDISVESSAGAVTLTGVVAGTGWKTRAVIVAANVKGDKSEKNDIEIGN